MRLKNKQTNKNKPLTSFILRSSFTTSVGFMSFCWKALRTLCQSLPSLQWRTMGDQSASGGEKQLPRHSHIQRALWRSGIEAELASRLTG